MADSRSPDVIQREIEATRAELADTIDAIADRVSPKKAASRGAQAVKAKASAALGTAERAAGEVAGKVGSHDGVRREPDIQAQQTTAADTGRIDPAEPTVLSSTGETIVNGRPASVLDASPEAAAGSSDRTVARLTQRSLRTDRVLVTVGIAAAAVGAFVLIRNRRG